MSRTDVEATTGEDVPGRIGGSTRSVATDAPSRFSSSTRSMIESAFPKVGDLQFSTFTSFILVLFAFAAFTDTILCMVVAGTNKLGQLSFPIYVQVLNLLWICLQSLLLIDLLYVFFRYYRPRPRDNDKPKMGDSFMRQPHIWRVCECMVSANMTSRSYLLILSLLLPLNALLFYDGLGRPVYTVSRLEAFYNATALTQPESWPQGGGLEVDLSTWEVREHDDKGNASFPFEPPLLITSEACYDPASAEYAILRQLRSMDGTPDQFPKQAYCDSLIGTVMARSFEDSVDPSLEPWRLDEDKWDEAFEFALRLFSSLAGVVADQSEGANTMLSMVGWSFLKDMTDLFDMFMLTFADVDQMHEGRPQLSGNHGIDGYERSYHELVSIAIWVGMLAVLLRALAVIGITPFVFLFRKCSCGCTQQELRRPIDAFFSLLFIEVPFCSLRWIAWYQYGVPVSVMAVKNVFGIYEDLYILGLVQGFGERKPRGCCLLCRHRSASGEAAGGASSG